MSRPLRIEYPDALYHVTVRGNAKNDIFHSDFDREVFLKIFSGAVRMRHRGCPKNSKFPVVAHGDAGMDRKEAIEEAEDRD